MSSFAAVKEIGDLRSSTVIKHGDRDLVGILFGSKDERVASQNFIRQIENQLNHRVKIIRSDNGTEFKNRDMLEFCGNKGNKHRVYSNARTPQQNGVAKRMNMTLIEAARTMLADSLLPTTFWAEAVSTACYILIVNTGSESVNTGSFDPDDSPMPELEIFHKSETGIFNESIYEES
ncbi:putative ribonuclease H-like domain-containing protein [Tanacetum coccineum]